MGEHLLCKQRVRGSSPRRSTTLGRGILKRGRVFFVGGGSIGGSCHYSASCQSSNYPKLSPASRFFSRSAWAYIRSVIARDECPSRSVTAWRWFDHRLAGHCFRLNAAQANRDQLSPASRSLMRKQMSSRAGGTARGQGGAERQEDRPARLAHDVAESAPCSTRRLTLRALGTSLKTTSYAAVRVPGGLEGAAFQDQGFLAAIRHGCAG